MTYSNDIVEASIKLYFKLKSENSIDIYGIAWHDFKDKTISYLEKNGNPYKRVALDSQGLFTRIIGIKAVPETLVVSPEGVVVLRYQGNLTDEIIPEIKKFIAKNKSLVKDVRAHLLAILTI